MRPLVKKLDMLLAPARGYSTLRKRIKDVMHLLKHDVEEISSYLDELTEVEDPPPMAKCWMNEARDLSYDMEDYIDSLLFVPPGHFIKKKKKKKKGKKKMVIKKRLKWCKQIVFTKQVSEHGIKTSKIIHVNVPRLPNKPKVAKIILQFRIYVQEAIERYDKYRLHHCSTLRRRLLFSGSMLSVPIPYEEAAQIVTDGRMNEFISSLAANNAADQQQLKVVSVLGSGCLGKTTLANVLYDRIGMQFECRAFIRVSKKPDMKRLFRDLLSQFHQKQPLPTSCNELGISDNIIKHLQDKRYLIVIDDLWDLSIWDIIKYAFPKGNHGSRIIITTQIEDVALTCCCDHSEHVFEMKPLNIGHSRELFFNRLFGSESDCLEEFKRVSNEIVDICGGLPLATINIASHLANQETEVSMDLLTDTRDLLRGLHALTDLSLYVETAPIDKIIFDKAGFSVLKYCKLRFAAGIAWLKFEADAMPSLWKLKLVFNAIPRMDQNLVFFHHDRPAMHQRGAAVIIVEHMPGLRVISAKFGGTASDLEYASRTVVSNHPSNPTINMQLVCYSSSGERSRKRKQQPYDVVKGQPDEYAKRLERPAEKRISTPTKSSLRLHVPVPPPAPARPSYSALRTLLKSWFFHYSYRSSSQNYVMFKGWTGFVKEKFLEAGDTVSFSRGVGEATRGRLFIDCQNEQSGFGVAAPRPPQDDQGRYAVLQFEDGSGNGKVWPFQFEASGQYYLLTGLNYFVNDRDLAAGYTVSFYRAGTRLFVDSGRKDDKVALGTRRRERIYPKIVRSQ
ncbi:hypothetical protein ZWY2020_019345 [Hordeum vulgare]|nr:hypothetical protein ZWY2020_019345 [Hordeum vulgare]